MELEREEADFNTITEEEEPDFRALAAAALDNYGINLDVQIRAANNNIGVNAEPWGPAIVEADQDEIVYEITFDLPDAGLAPGQNAVPAGADSLAPRPTPALHHHMSHQNSGNIHSNLAGV